jgi:hypothetical protein
MVRRGRHGFGKSLAEAKVGVVYVDHLLEIHLPTGQFDLREDWIRVKVDQPSYPPLVPGILEYAGDIDEKVYRLYDFGSFLSR